jgi:uncharacterized spore protein YtfJ
VSMMLQEVFKSISERLQSAATVKTVYGDPITAEGKTIIPVARVRYGFGGGGGSRGDNGSQEGGGGGVEVTPIGILEVTPGETRFISFEDRRRMLKAALIAFLVSAFLFSRRRRK